MNYLIFRITYYAPIILEKLLLFLIIKERLEMFNKKNLNDHALVYFIPCKKEKDNIFPGDFLF